MPTIVRQLCNVRQFRVSPTSILLITLLQFEYSAKKFEMLLMIKWTGVALDPPSDRTIPAVRLGNAVEKILVFVDSNKCSNEVNYENLTMFSLNLFEGLLLTYYLF